MKKFIALLALALGFGANVNAQSLADKLAAQESAQKSKVMPAAKPVTPVEHKHPSPFVTKTDVKPIDAYVPPSPFATKTEVKPVDFYTPQPRFGFNPEPTAIITPVETYGSSLRLVSTEKPADPFAEFLKSGTAFSKFDVNKLSEYRKGVVESKHKISEDKYVDAFPKLKNEKFEVMGKPTGHPDQTKTRVGTYNCIAWSAGVTSQWEWPCGFKTVNGKSVQYSNVKMFDEFYRKHGFTRLDLRDYSVVPGKQKAVLFAKLNADGVLEPTHACRQEADGTWSSKLGGGALIKHETPESVNGPCYGEPIAVYIK